MATYIPGKSTCGICEALVGEDELVMCPAFVVDPNDKLAPFHDGIFHDYCYFSSPLVDEVEDILKIRESMWKPENRVCLVCHEKMDNPDNHFGTGYLSGELPLKEYNFRMLHKSCIPNWTEAEKFKIAVESIIQTGKWGDSRTLIFLLKEFE